MFQDESDVSGRIWRFRTNLTFQDESTVLQEKFQVKLHLCNQKNVHSKLNIYVDKDKFRGTRIVKR